MTSASRESMMHGEIMGLVARCCYQHYGCCFFDEDKNNVADGVRAINTVSAQTKRYSLYRTAIVNREDIIHYGV